MMTRLFVQTLCVFVCVIIPACLSCRCSVPKLHNQDKFCDPTIDFVLRVKIKKRISLATEVKYKIKLFNNGFFRTSAAFLALSNRARKQLWTLKGSSACEANLMKKKVYVITGRVGSGKMWISSCDWFQQWNQLLPVQQFNIENNFLPNCDCSFDQVGGAPPPFPFPPTSCVLISTQVSCGKYAFCKCTNPSCTSCSIDAQQPEYTNCKNQFPLPPQPPPGLPLSSS